MCVASAALYESFEHVQKKIVYPVRIIFILAYWECVVIVFVEQRTCYILLIFTVYYVIRACNIWDEQSANVTW